MEKKATLLDANQVLQHVYDDDNHSLRTTSNTTVVEGNLELAVSHENDSIKIGDGVRFASVARDNSLKVSSGVVKEAFDYFAGEHTDTISVYTYKRGGILGTIVAKVTIIYTDSSKNQISSLKVE